MIFVSVGTQKFQMDRLLKAVDRLAEEKLITEDVFIQKGYSTYAPKYCHVTDFYSNNEMSEKIKKASILICHAGVGTILSGLRSGKKIIVMPRCRKYGEHVDDHQIEIARAFAESGYVKMVREVEELSEGLEQIYKWEPVKFVSNTEHFLKLLLEKLSRYE